MDICDGYGEHPEIVHDEVGCPLCEALEKYDSLADEVEGLDAQVNGLEQDLEDSEEVARGLGAKLEKCTCQ